MTLRERADGHDLLVVADRIHTCSSAGTVGAVLVRIGRIAAAGPAAELRHAAPRARVIDLPGCTVTPGLTDAHVHLTEWAFARREVDLSASASPAHAAALTAAADGSANGGWVRGRGWNPHAWPDPHPHRAQLDERVRSRPVALQSHDMHALWVNSAALDAAGITAATPDPDGGTIVRDAGGEPTGLLLEWAGRLVTQHIPAPTLLQAADAVCDAQQELHTLGITGVHSFPGVHLLEPDAMAVVQALHADGRLALRVLQHIPHDRLDAVIRTGIRSGFGDDWLRFGALKLFLDGALGSRTAWMREPYEDGSGRGMQVLAADEFRDIVRHAAAHGVACTVHAIGDAAVCLALDVLGDPAVRVAALPHRIEHVQCCPAERLGDAAARGIVCSMQPSHLITDWSVADRYWGAARARGTYAVGSLLRHGTILAFGSDVPVEPVDPRRGLHAAIHRRDTADNPAGGWFPEECIAAQDALAGYTVGPARAAGLAAPAGSLAPGAAADFVAWDHDPCGPATALLSMRCVAAFIEGTRVYTS
jgi:predicted amidohydrolase YtcJ